jgi:hypothetical protein
MYLGARIGWMRFVRSPMGMEWMTRITPADVKMISDTLAKYPGEKVEAGQAITATLEDTVRNGGPAPNVGKFSSILTPEEQREIMKTVKDINELKARGITPPDVTAKASGEGRTVGKPEHKFDQSGVDDATPEGVVGKVSKGPRYPSGPPQSSSEAGGSGTAEGAAADTADIVQARKNLGIAPGAWDNRLLAEAQRVKDQRLKSTSSVEPSKPSVTESGSHTRLGPATTDQGVITRSVNIGDATIGYVRYTVSGDTLTIERFDTDAGMKSEMRRALGEPADTSGQLTLIQQRDMARQIKAEHPEVKFFEAVRTGGARGSEGRRLRVPIERVTGQ